VKQSWSPTRCSTAVLLVFQNGRVLVILHRVELCLLTLGKLDAVIAKPCCFLEDPGRISWVDDVLNGQRPKNRVIFVYGLRRLY